ncbi:MAG: aminotransferase class V-fold PLP-dependent enzyme [Calditrichaeota bacterium]|nr:MAG: aminotransferase class V-fold PLP-dependent enzyme [Calditrichota bacterium]
MENWQRFRNLFPHTSSIIYLNHAAVSPMNVRAIQALQEHMEKRSSVDIEFWPAAMETKKYFKTLLAKLLHTHPDYIALTENTSMGLNWLARGLTWKKGDRILLNNFEFPSNVYPFLNLRELGVEIDFVEHRNGKILVEDLARAIQPSTRLLSISFVEFLNGYRNDLATISQLCQEHDIIFCVDAIQGLGALDLDVEQLQIDFLAAAGHKWLMWPLGCGFFYISPRIFSRVKPMALGWMSVENSWDFFNYELTFPPTAERFEPSIYPVPTVIGAIPTLELFLEIGIPQIEQRILYLTDYLIDGLRQRGYRLFTVTDPPHRSGIVTFYHPSPEELVAFLISQQVKVSVRAGTVRVSPHFYNTTQELDRLLELLDQFERKQS